MTTIDTVDHPGPAATHEPLSTDVRTDIYAPQDDSRLLIDACRLSGRIAGADVADLCTGSGVVAAECARLGAHSVMAIDSSPIAARAAAANCESAPCPVTVRCDDFASLIGAETFDVVTCNPPYVPTPPIATERFTECAGPRHAWVGGPDGRDVLDQLCCGASALLRPGGTLFLVQSTLSDVRKTIAMLQSTGLRAGVIARCSIPFGPVLTARVEWLERSGLIERGNRVEQLVVVRADRPRAR